MLIFVKSRELKFLSVRTIAEPVYVSNVNTPLNIYAVFIAQYQIIWINCDMILNNIIQVYMDIAVCQEEIKKGITTHLELGPCSMLSALASLTPYSDFNQSPRNMYQCQVGHSLCLFDCLKFVVY